MGFEISDETMLRVSGVAQLAYGFGAMAAPRKLNDLMLSSSVPYAAPTWRFCGHAIADGGFYSLICAASDSKATKKAALKYAGFSWLTVGALTAANMRNSTQPKREGGGNLAFMTLMGGALLWKGLQD